MGEKSITKIGKEDFRVGEKVKLRGNHGFENGATGTIAYPPGISTFYDETGESFYRKRQTSEGEKIFLWVIFDEPQIIAEDDEDGPYVSAEIDIDNLELVEE